VKRLYTSGVSSRFNSATDTGSNFTKTTAIYLCKHTRRILSLLYAPPVNPSVIDPLLTNYVALYARDYARRVYSSNRQIHFRVNRFSLVFFIARLLSSV